MATSKNRFRSSLSKARGLGASGHAVSHWWLQRLTAVAMIILFPLFIASFLSYMLTTDVIQMSNWFAPPINALGMMLLMIALFWHGKLGVQVVIEDYIKHPFAKYGLLIANNFVAIAFTLLALVAILRLHLVDLTTFPT